MVKKKTKSSSRTAKRSGRERRSDENFCKSCGKRIDRRAYICPRCGVKQHSSSKHKNKKSRIVAALLGIFLGGIGAHKFYLDKPGWGLLYLCFFWTYIPAIIGFIEGIIYLTKSDEDFERMYG